jgi:hypothetical protein
LKGEVEMREEMVKVCQFSELSEGAKEKAREWFKDRMNEGFDFEAEQITEDFSYELEELGYPTEDIRWCLSHVQGDGVAFYGDINYDGFLKISDRLLNDDDVKLLRNNLDNIGINIKIYSNDYHYNHFNTMSLETDVRIYFDEEKEELSNKITCIIDDLIDSIKDEIKVVSKRLARVGYEQIDYFHSNTYIDETIEANEWEFTEDGERWR